MGIKYREFEAVELHGLSVIYVSTTYTGGPGLGGHHELKWRPPLLVVVTSQGEDRG